MLKEEEHGMLIRAAIVAKFNVDRTSKWANDIACTSEYKLQGINIALLWQLEGNPIVLPKHEYIHLNT